MRLGRRKHISQSASSYLENRLGELNASGRDCLKSAWARVQALEEFLKVAGLPEEETHQDQNRAALLDLAQVPAQAAE
jgi:Mn-dependent DtxR family transcriptional regulator